MADRRKLFRSRVLKSAKFVLGTSSTLNCMVRNFRTWVLASRFPTLPICQKS